MVKALKVDHELHRQVAIACAVQDKKIKAWIEEAIKEKLSREQVSSDS